MSRINLALFLLLIVSAIFLIQVKYESRRLLDESYRAQAVTRQLDVERQRLEVEKRSQASPLNVETQARARLHMESVAPGNTHYYKTRSKALPGAEGKAAEKSSEKADAKAGTGASQ